MSFTDDSQTLVNVDTTDSPIPASGSKSSSKPTSPKIALRKPTIEVPQSGGSPRRSSSPTMSQFKVLFAPATKDLDMASLDMPDWRRPCITPEHERSLARASEGFAAPCCGGQVVTDRMGFHVEVFPDGSRFEGQWHDGRRHGKGHMKCENGDVYEGEWLNGQPHGKGKLHAKHSKYVGEWANSLKHGQATEEWDDTSAYTGSYTHGKKHGRGHYIWPDDSNYDGEFQNNMIAGDGTFTCKDHRSYTGQWLRNKPHGDGRFDWPDGCMYQGQYVDSLPEGEGTLSLANGKKFTGQWKGGLRHGSGTMSMAGGPMCSGQWQSDVLVCWTNSAPYERKLRSKE